MQSQSLDLTQTPGRLIQQSPELRRAILDLQGNMESWLKEKGIENFEPPVRHHFAPGLYAREMMIPAGTLIIGKIHRHAHLNVVERGLAWLFTEEGRVLIQAPYKFVSPIGVKRVVFAIEDTLWTTFHVTNETDLEKIEEEVIAKDYGALGLPEVGL